MAADPSGISKQDRFLASLTDDGRSRLLVDAITDYAIYMLHLDGQVSSWNPGAQRLKGYVAAEIIGHHFSRFYTPEDKVAGVPAKALAIARTEGRATSEGWCVRKDGTRFWAAVVIDPIRTPEGELCPPGEKGILVLERPFPSLTPALWGEPERMIAEGLRRAISRRGRS